MPTAEKPMQKPPKKLAALAKEPQKKLAALAGDVPKQKGREKGAGKIAGSGNPMSSFRSRIVGHEDVSPALIKPHALNYRKHPESQMGALRGSMDDMGWLKTVLVSKRTHTIIDGHARWEEAQRRKILVPVTWLDLTPDEENKALALLDPITEMATRDDALFAQLLDSIESDNEAVKQTLSKLSELKDEEMTGGKVEESTAILEYTTDVFFPSTSKWGIPDLLPNMLYDGPCPTTTWPYEDDQGRPQFYVYGEGGFDERVTGRILTFYTDDFRFERIWSESVDAIRTIVPLKPLAACQPDFSLWGTDPLAVQMFNLYRARWISRYWQEAGIKIIPSIAGSFFPACHEFITHGLPADIPVASIQVRSDGTKTKQQVDSICSDIAKYLENRKIGKIIVYGIAAKKVLEGRLPKGPEYVWCMPFADAWFANGQKMKAEKKAANLLKLQGKG